MGTMLEKRYIVLVFVAGMIMKRFVKDFADTHTSIAFLIGVCLIYMYTKWRHARQTSEYDRLEKEYASRLAALYEEKGLAAPKATSHRATQFRLLPREAALITDRMHQYSKKLSGSQKERRMFLHKRKQKKAMESIETVASQTDTAIAENKQQQITLNKVVEEAVTATL